MSEDDFTDGYSSDMFPSPVKSENIFIGNHADEGFRLFESIGNHADERIPLPKKNQE